jgi:hypothetical protein
MVAESDANTRYHRMGVRGDQTPVASADKVATAPDAKIKSFASLGKWRESGHFHDA